MQRATSPLGWIILGLFAGTALGGACGACLSGVGGQRDEVFAGSKDKVGVVELTGAITDATEVTRHLRDFAKRDDLKGIVVRIDSPGGAVAPSQEIYAAMRRASKTKPVVASMGSVAASGGFWSALGADWIFASPGSVTGSIGVITQVIDLHEIADLVKVRVHTFKSGLLKDVGNPLRELTKDDRDLFMSLINDIYQQFISVVAERRKMDLDAVKKVADGRVMTGRAALEAGLIDELGTLNEAAKKVVQLAAARDAEKSGKLPKAKTSTRTDDLEDPTLIYPRKPLPGLLRMLADETESAVSLGISKGVERAAQNARHAFEPSSSVELR